MALTAYTFISPVGAGVVHTKGAYTQIVASTPSDSSRLFVMGDFASGAGRMVLMDIATGGAGTETDIVANLPLHVDSDQISSAFVPLNVQIPAGTRLSTRIQTSTLPSTSQTLHFYLDTRALASLTNPVTYGANTGASAGTQVDPGGTAGTKGAYVQLTASTSSRIDSVVMCVTVASTSALTAGMRWSIDLATGASGSEVILLADVTVTGGTGSDAVRQGYLYLPASIPAGTRLAVRCNCNVTTAGQRVLAVTVIGMQEPATGGGGSSATAVAYLG